MKAAENIKKEIVKRYDENPRDWSVYASRDVRGHYDLIVAHGSTAWIIKEEQINPLKFIGFGEKISRNSIEPLIRDIPNTFGIRSASRTHMLELTEALERKKSIKDLLTKIIASDPVKSNEIKSPMMIQGPMFYSAKPINSISEEQIKLDSKLRAELESLLNKKYPQVFRPYI